MFLKGLNINEVGFCNIDKINKYGWLNVRDFNDIKWLF